MKKFFCILSFFLLSVNCFGFENNEKDIFLQVRNFLGNKGNSETVKLLNFLEQNSAFAEPNVRGIKYLEDPKGHYPFAMVFLSDKHKGISAYWDQMLSFKSAGANFLPEYRTLIMKRIELYSPAGKTIMLIHEGYHAYLFLQNPYEGHQSDKDYCYEEVRVHTFQNQVMSLLGGKLYQKILADEVDRISKNAKISKKGYSLSGRIEYDERLAIAFGSPASQAEKDFIQIGVWINAIFVFLDKNFKKDAMDKKAFFLRMLYKESGIL